MSEQISEQIYDEQIAPLLVKVAELCKSHGMSLVAAVEYKPGSLGHTRMLAEDWTAAIVMVDEAVAACGNIDRLVISVVRRAKQYGHDSMILDMMERAGNPGHGK